MDELESLSSFRPACIRRYSVTIIKCDSRDCFPLCNNEGQQKRVEINSIDEQGVHDFVKDAYKGWRVLQIVEL